MNEKERAKLALKKIENLSLSEIEPYRYKISLSLLPQKVKNILYDACDMAVKSKSIIDAKIEFAEVDFD